MLPNWLLGKSKSKLQEILGGGGGTSYTAGDGIDISNGVISFDPATTPAIDPSKVDGLDEDLAALTPKTAITNPNLLDNSWFTINQRGENSYTGNKYTVDRWKSESANLVVTHTQNGITLENIGESGNCYFAQYIPSIQSAAFTLSVKASNVTGSPTFYVHYTDDTWMPGAAISGDEEITSWTEHSGKAVDRFQFTIPAGAAVTVRAAKLEAGEVSTLAMDAAPNYTIELIKCKRYFQVFTGDLGRAMTVLTNRIQFNVPLPIRLYSSPTVTATPRIFNLDTTEVTGFTFSYSAINNYQTLRINADKTAHGLTDAYVNAGTEKLYISADL